MNNFMVLRNMLDKTQTEMAVLIGVSLTTWRMWEKGVTKPNDENMKKINELAK